MAEGVVVPLGALWLILDLSTKIMAMTLFWLLTVPSSVCVITVCLLPATHISSCFIQLQTVAVHRLILFSFLFFSHCCGVKKGKQCKFSHYSHLWALTKHSQPWSVFVLRHRPAKANPVTKQVVGRQSVILFLYLHGCFPTGVITQNTRCFAVGKLQLPPRSNGKESPCNIAYHCTRWTLLT